jgi:hypothetical protein
MMSANLIPRPRRAKSERRRRTRVWLRFLRAYGILLAVACSLTMLPARAESLAVSSTLSRLDKRIETTTAALETLKKETAELARALAVAQAVGDHPDWSLVLQAVARSRGSDITLESVDLTTAHPGETPAKSGEKPKPYSRDIHTIRLSGFASSPAAAFQFANRLEVLAFADKVTVKDTHAQPLSSAGTLTTTHFDIEILIASVPVMPEAKDKEGGSK